MNNNELIYQQELALETIENFHSTFGDSHLYFALHASFPSALTPDLLHSIRESFFYKNESEIIYFPWIAVSDILLSPLCKSIGYDTYEMDSEIRIILIEQLKQEPNFGICRLKELSDFMINYIKPYEDIFHANNQNLYKTQKWAAQIHFEPETVLNEIKTEIAGFSKNLAANENQLKSNLKFNTYNSLISYYLQQIEESKSKDFEFLFEYTNVMDLWAHNNIKKANELCQLYELESNVSFDDTVFYIPKTIRLNNQNNKEFNEIIQQAENKFIDKDYNVAKELYNKALSIIENQEIKEKLIEIENILNKYNSTIKDATNYFNNANYILAINKYEESLKIYPNQEFPITQIEKIEKLINNINNSNRKSGSKLYVIALGGTGSRVMQSLVILLSSGIQINASAIVPMIIDTDIGNGNLLNYLDLANQYSRINRQLYANSNMPQQKTFFGTEIFQPVHLSIDGRQFDTLQGIINYNGMNNHYTKSLIDLLFSKQELKMPLDKGFFGNPNIGSIVLNQIVNNSEEFKKFTQDFREGDRIIIVNSVFGGTGAAGLPLLIKNFRYNEEIEKYNIIRNSIIGAISVLPYFVVSKQPEQFENEKSIIDSNTFIEKTKSTLAYYNKYINKDLNAIYYIGDYKNNILKNQNGESQRNPAHFIEFAAAQSIIDFMNLEPEISEFSNMKTQQNFFEFCINNDSDIIDFSQLFDEYNYTPFLIKQFFFRQYFNEFFQKSLAKNTSWCRNIKLERSFIQSELFYSLKRFFNHYDIWLGDLKQQNRIFEPFKSERANEKNLLTLINGKKPKINRSIFGKESIPEIEFDSYFNEIKLPTKNGSTEQKFLYIINEGIELIYRKNFN